MRIGIDARLVTYRRGMGNYAFHLVDELVKLPTNAEFVIYTDHPDAAGHLPSSPRVQQRVLRPAAYPLWEQVLLPRAVRQDRLDVLHCLFNTAPLRLPSAPTQLLVTIHDVMFALPASIVPRRVTPYHELGRRYRDFVVGRVAARAPHIITDSRCSRDDLVRILGVDADRISIIPLAVDDVFRPLPPSEASRRVRAAYGVEADYILAFGAGDPRKNTARVIEAFARQTRRGAASLQLLIVGLTAGPEAAFRRQAAALGVGDRIRTAAFIPQDDLVQLYSQATMFLYPSLYEGFGFPVLEANACGAPVITSNSGSIAELTDDSALVVDPLDVDDIAEAMHRLASDSTLRARLSASGLERVRQFSWRRVAEETYHVYEALVRGELAGAAAADARRMRPDVPL